MKTNKKFVPPQEAGESFPVSMDHAPYHLVIDSQNKGQVFITTLLHVVAMYQSKGLFFIELTSNSHLIVSEVEFNRVKSFLI